ncbi:MAG: protein kinase [Elusimicrobia bacterium]|nr:protein kinase [Elusimicrobiota bacterium]
MAAALSPVKNYVTQSNDSELQTYAGNLYLGGANRPDLAVEMTNLAIQNDRSYAPAYTVRGAASLALGDAKGAAADAREAMRLAPGDPSARSLLQYAQARLQMEQAGGKKAFNKAQNFGQQLKTAVPDEESLDGGAEPGARPRPARPQQAAWSVSTFGAAPSLPGAPASETSVAGQRLVREAQNSREMGDNGRAATLLDKALALNPRNCDALNLRADVHSSMGQYGAATAAATSSLQNCPDNVPALDVRALALNKLGQFPRALSDADASIQHAPRSPFGYLNRADAEEGLSRLQDMAKDLRRAAALDRQYEPRYEAKAAQYGLPVEPVTVGTDASLFADGEHPAAKGAQQPRSSRFGLLTWVLATLIGGFMIALGLFHAWSRGSTTRSRRATASARPGSSAGAETPAAPADAEEGTRLKAPFILRQPIGRGGMGVVYEGWDVNLDRRVAIKKMREEISRDPRERERFIKEARLVASLEHPAIVGVHSIFEEDGELYLVFEYVEGLTMDALLHDQGRLSLAEASRLLRPVCEALDFAHSRRVIHRDLKPANVMVTPSDKVKVMDFGIARVAKDTLAKLSATNTIAGTPIYMPPEADDGLVGAAGDIYSLGVMAYEMLSARPPFGSPGLRAAKLSRSYARLSTLGADLAAADAAVHAALDPDPEKRPKSALAFWESLSGNAPSLS